jgi:putative membrane protein
MRYLSTEDHKIVSDAVAEAETRTSGEIVTVLADRSDGYSDIQLAWAALASFLALGVFAAIPEFYLDKIDWLTGDWNREWSSRAVLFVALVLATLKFACVWLFLLIDPIRFLLVPGRLKSRRVRLRAISHFKVGAERRTHGHTGVLLYLSMREHRAEIVADEAIAGKVEPEVWGEAMADMLSHVRDGKVAEGLAAGVRDVGAVLAEFFPRDGDDDNELPDRLIEV